MAGLVVTFISLIGLIISSIISIIFYLISRFNVLSSGLLVLLCYIFTYKYEWDKAVYILGALIIFIVSIALQYGLKIFRIIYVLFTCCLVSLVGTAFMGYETEKEMYIKLVICFLITAFLGYVSWCGISEKEKLTN